MAPEPERLTATIRQKNGQWCVYSEDGKRSFGCYPNREKAEERLRQIEHFKRVGAESADETRAAQAVSVDPKTPWVAISQPQKTFADLPRGLPAKARRIEPQGRLLVVAVGASLAEDRTAASSIRKAADFPEAQAKAAKLADSTGAVVLILGQALGKVGRDEARPVLVRVEPEKKPQAKAS